jgi:hypothetical protein
LRSTFDVKYASFLDFVPSFLALSFFPFTSEMEMDDDLCVEKNLKEIETIINFSLDCPYWARVAIAAAHSICSGRRTSSRATTNDDSLG